MINKYTKNKSQEKPTYRETSRKNGKEIIIRTMK